MAAIFLEILFCYLLLLEHMGFNLVYSRLYFREVLNVQITVRAKVGNTDSAKLASLIQLLHSTVGKNISEKLIDIRQQLGFS